MPGSKTRRPWPATQVRCVVNCGRPAYLIQRAALVSLLCPLDGGYRLQWVKIPHRELQLAAGENYARRVGHGLTFQAAIPGRTPLMTADGSLPDWCRPDWNDLKRLAPGKFGFDADKSCS